MSIPDRVDVDGARLNAQLLRAVAALRPLAAQLPRPLRVALLADPAASADPVALADLAAHEPHAADAVHEVVGAAFAAAGIDGLRFAPAGQADFSSFEMLISETVSQALEYRYDGFAHASRSDAALRAVRSFDFVQPAAHVVHSRLPVGAGTALSVYASAARNRPALVLVPPFGMPFGLYRDWFVRLAQRYFVVSWETRALFGECTDFDRADTSMAAQVGDLVAVMDHFGLDEAHVMGICGGAAVALCAAPRLAQRIDSLSLWYGDYQLGDASLRTQHQQNFEWLMETAAQDREQAGQMQQLFTDPSILGTVPRSIAHLALYPYANPELMYRYARLNAGLYAAQLMPALHGIAVPTLVVSGDNDSTTHCGGSQFIAQQIAGARFHLERGGNHEGLFSVPDGLHTLLLEFLETAREEAVN
ncbi:alpha/beta fold hydrolase [Paraburkholderia jirisanensis]